MFRKKLSVIALFLSITTSLFRSSAIIVKADELVVSGNGAGSSNEVTLEASNNTSIEQSNNADIDNNVNANSDTGGNEATDNTGGNTDITTGDIETDVEVTTTANSSVVDNECCPGGDLTIEIKGNGSDSDSAVNVSSNTETNISVNQNADIRNDINGSANTGDNRANDNLGNVTIDTGSIWAKVKVKNAPVNISHVSGGSMDPNVLINVSENGSGSNNLVTLLLNDLANININNQANFENKFAWNLNTGGNEANGNNGDVSIKTGNIWFDLFVENRANESHVDWGCCEPPVTPPPPPGGNGGPPPGVTNPPVSSNPGPTSLSEIIGGGGAGPNVLGLSFTNGLFDNPLNFWIGIGLLAFGLNLLKSNKKSVPLGVRGKIRATYER